MTDEQGVQESLLAPYKRTRKGDPETSLAAAASVKELTEKQKSVLAVLKQYGPATDGELRQKFPPYTQSDSGLRTRRSELVNRGLVRDSGERRRLASGRMAIVWEAPDGQ